MEVGPFQAAVATLLEEVLIGPPDPRGTWLVSNEADSGVLGTLRRVDAATAMRTGAAGTSAAQHAAHLRFALSLANRALRGENPYPTADWKSSWRLSGTGEAAWREVLAGLEDEVARLREAVAGPISVEGADETMGGVALVGHCAYHLGAIRQLVGGTAPDA